MNLLLLFEPDFIDAARTVVRLFGRRREHAMSVWKVAVGDEVRAGILNGNMGTARVEKMSGDFMEMSVSLDDAPPPCDQSRGDPDALLVARGYMQDKSLRGCRQFRA